MMPQASFPQSLSFFLLVIELLVCSSTSIFSLPSYSLFTENWLLAHYSTENDHSKLTSNIHISKLYRSARFSIVDHILLKTFSSFSLLRHQILLMHYLVIWFQFLKLLCSSILFIFSHWITEFLRNPAHNPLFSLHTVSLGHSMVLSIICMTRLLWVPDCHIQLSTWYTLGSHKDIQ